MPIEQAERFCQSDQQALAADHPCVNEEWVIYAGGVHQALLEVTKSTVRDAQGRLIGVLGVAHDITERKQREVEFQLCRNHLERMVEARTTDLSLAKEAAEAATQAKSIFLASMSHSLRTPLNGIMGMTNLAGLRATDPKQIDQLNKVSPASQNLLAVISDILDIARIEADKLTLEKTEFSLNAILEDVTARVGASAAIKHLTLHSEITPALTGLTLVGDPHRLGQVLLNLVANAIKFTANGSITLRALLVEDMPAEVSVLFEVRDTGTGIAAEDMQRDFNAFERTDAGRVRKYGGTGLGLSISERLVTLMGGEIDAECQIGVGSTFSFTVRLGKLGHAATPREETAARSASTQLQARHAGAMILVVEDDLMNQEIAQNLIEEAGLVAHVALTGSEAVKMVMQSRYDAILMDIQMPEMDGLEATRQIRRLSCTAQTTSPGVAIIALTANVFAEDEQRCREAGMNDFIGRPVETEFVLATLLKWLDARQL